MENSWGQGGLAVTLFPPLSKNLPAISVPSGEKSGDLSPVMILDKIMTMKTKTRDPLHAKGTIRTTLNTWQSGSSLSTHLWISSGALSWLK